MPELQLSIVETQLQEAKWQSKAYAKKWREEFSKSLALGREGHCGGNVRSAKAYAEPVRYNSSAVFINDDSILLRPGFRKSDMRNRVAASVQLTFGFRGNHSRIKFIDNLDHSLVNRSGLVTSSTTAIAKS